ncbi:hypothetical protein COCCU_07470 [Corynebacterium occultum]|uniref:Prolipoprotein LppL n=1 Tax=Corynebacterium occultum TaxID=2675219 RepID=A0A6B8WM14_9CORY|nr:hypothetical protein [Corynebacterium occultum]QGU07428.1 hypothetical protein COCCU_07470 [Corynebacterium occultum]
MKKRGLILGSLAVTATVVLSGCTTGSVPEPGPDMGNAAAVVSPAATDPAGRIIDIPAERAGITDMELAGEIIALRSENTLSIGELSAQESGAAEVLAIDSTCGDLAVSGAGDTFTLPCGNTLYLIDALNPNLDEVLELQAPATVATQTSTGEVLVGNDVEDSLTIYRAGEEATTFAVEGANTQLISVPVKGQPDAVVRTWNPETLIQDVDWTNDRQGATLRVGIGLGQMAGGPDGLVLVSDNLAPQIAVYSATDIIRLHQTAPVDESPWGLAWDPANELAWIASTAENTLSAYDISEGVPTEQAKLNSVADAKNILVLQDGTLLAASESGDGLQVIEQPLS